MRFISKSNQVPNVDVLEKLNASDEWEECPGCGAFDAFVTKAIPRKILFLSILPSLALAFYFLDQNWMWGFGILLGLAIVDFLLYQCIPNMLVCYQCNGELRDLKTLKDAHRFKTFDHHLAERYRQKKL